MAPKLTRVALRGGRYEGVLEADGQVPVIELVHRERVVAVAEVSGADGKYAVTADLPPEVMADGVQVVALRSAVDGEVLDRLTMLFGSGLDGDYRAELALLRDELDLLKSAFRRHCQETGED